MFAAVKTQFCWKNTRTLENSVQLKIVTEQRKTTINHKKIRKMFRWFTGVTFQHELSICRVCFFSVSYFIVSMWHLTLATSKKAFFALKLITRAPTFVFVVSDCRVFSLRASTNCVMSLFSSRSILQMCGKMILNFKIIPSQISDEAQRSDNGTEKTTAHHKTFIMIVLIENRNSARKSVSDHSI